MSYGVPKIKLWNNTKKRIFRFLPKNFAPMDKVEIFFGQFPNPLALRVSGMGCYTSKCEKSQNHCTLIVDPFFLYQMVWIKLKKHFTVLCLYVNGDINVYSPRIFLDLSCTRCEAGCMYAGTWRSKFKIQKPAAVNN
jgi:hypothetical protein